MSDKIPTAEEKLMDLKTYFKRHTASDGKEALNGYALWEDITQANMDGIIAHGLEPQPKFRKLKLFLCSRDIEEYDIVDNVHGDEKGTVVHIYPENAGYEVEVNDTMTIYKPHEIFKVIGEISPDAKWVKEGDEYLFGKVDKNGYICPYNQEDEKYIEFWTERGFRDLPNI